MEPGGQVGTDVAVLGGDPRSTVGGGSAATVLDDAAGAEMISASTTMGATNPKTRASAPIAEGLGWEARSLIKIGMVRARCCA